MTRVLIRPLRVEDQAALGAAMRAAVPAGVDPLAVLTAYPAWVVEWDGVRAWAGGVVPFAPGIGEAWLVAAPEVVATHPRRLAREIHRGLVRMAEHLRLATLTAHFPADAPPAHQAFAMWLGFRAGASCAFDALGQHHEWSGA